MSGKIEEAIRTFLLTRSAVTALTNTIRPDQLQVGDCSKTDPDAIVITVQNEKPCNFLSGRHDLIYSTVKVIAISERKSRARTLALAIKNNGTNPGTGLAAANEALTGGALPFDATWDAGDLEFYPYQDGSVKGLHAASYDYTVSYRDAI